MQFRVRSHIILPLEQWPFVVCRVYIFVFALNSSIFVSLLISGSSISSLESAVHPFPQTSPIRCNEINTPKTPCSCLLEMCIGWYPCGLKFCKGKIDNGIGNNASYRCGIKTCRKCNQFTYYVQQKQQCLWDDWPNFNDYYSTQIHEENHDSMAHAYERHYITL